MKIAYNCENLFEAASHGEPVVIHSRPNAGKSTVLVDLAMSIITKDNTLVFCVDPEGAMLSKLIGLDIDKKLTFDQKSRLAMYSYLPVSAMNNNDSDVIAENMYFFIDDFRTAANMVYRGPNYGSDPLQVAARVYRDVLIPFAKRGGKVFLTMQSANYSSDVVASGVCKPEHSLSHRVFGITKQDNVLNVYEDKYA